MILNTLRKLLGKKGTQHGRPVSTPPADENAAAPPAVTVLDITVLDITDETVDAALRSNDGLLVMDFWAEWCQPCDIMSAHVAMLAQDFAGRLQIAAIDVDENPATSERFTVRGLPTLLFLRNGAEVDRVVGITAYEELVQRTETLLTAAQ